MHFDFDAADFDAFLHHAFGALEVIRAFDLLKGHRDDMLVIRHAGGQNLGDDGIGNHWEAVVDRSGCRGIFEIIDLTQGQHKGKDTRFWL